MQRKRRDQSEILRFAQNDSLESFFRNLFSTGFPAPVRDHAKSMIGASI